MDVNDYRVEAEEFLSAIDREYYLHFAGLKDEYEIEPIYARHARLFSRETVEALREGDNRVLLKFAAEGYVEQAVKELSAELARLEASLEVELDGDTYPFRQAAVVQANERDPARRRALERARNELVETHLNPVLREMFDRSRELVRELGLAERARDDRGAFGDRPGRARAADRGLPGRDRARGTRTRSSRGCGPSSSSASTSWSAPTSPYFFRAPSLDGLFPSDQLLPSYEATLAGLGLRNGAGGKVILDAEPRPKKSPRAFCAPVRVPDEVYLVLTRIGGREDYDTLLHESGHAEHFSHVDAALPVEHRWLGDNSVTEGFAFLFEHLAQDPAWLERRLGVGDPAPIVEHARASKLVFLRRYCAKLGYELELQGEGSADGLDELYARRLSEAVHVDWPAATWLSDVDAFFYVAAYLRAWALETHLRRELRDRFGELWFEDRRAGDLLRELWSTGQREPAHELLRRLTGAELDFSALLD